MSAKGGHHLIFNLDGTFRGYEWARFDENGELEPSKVYAQEGRDENGQQLYPLALLKDSDA